MTDEPIETPTPLDSPDPTDAPIDPPAVAAAPAPVSTPRVPRLRAAARAARVAKPAPTAPADPATGLRPLRLVSVVLALVSAGLLLGGLMFAFATAERTGVDAAGRFRLLGQAANPLIATLALAAALLVVVERRPGATAALRQQAASAALGVATAVSLAVLLLATSGVINDLTGNGGALFVLSALVTRLSAAGLSALTLWLSLTASPPK